MPQLRSRNHRCTRTFSSEQPAFQALETKMIRIAAAIFAAALSVSTAAAQSTAASGDKPETACTTSPAATTGSGEEKTANSMAVEKSAVLPDAGGAELGCAHRAERRQAAESQSGSSAGLQAEVFTVLRHSGARLLERAISPRDVHLFVIASRWLAMTKRRSHCDKSTRRANHSKSVHPFAQKYSA